MRGNVFIVAGLLLAGGLAVRAESLAWTRAHELYQRTDYTGSLEVLAGSREQDAAVFLLMGQDYFMLAQYKKASDALEKAAALAPQNPECFLWLGRAYGRRAEIANPFTAPGYASKARQMFERSVALDPSNREAVGDLFDYYLSAPGFLGGGANKAAALAEQVAESDPAEGHYYQARLDEHRKEYDSAEQHLRTALELAPRQVGRVIELAKYLCDAWAQQGERRAVRSGGADCSGRSARDLRACCGVCAERAQPGRGAAAVAAVLAGADYA